MTFFEILLIIVCVIIVSYNVFKYIHDFKYNTECKQCNKRNLIKEYKKWISENTENPHP